MEKFIWLGSQSLGGMIFAWPISLPLAFWFCIAVAQRGRSLWSRRLLWLIPNMLLPLLLIIWGAVFSHPRGERFPRWQLDGIWYQFMLALVLAALAIGLNPGRRALVTPAAILLLMLTFFCAFTSGSAVTSDWL